MPKNILIRRALLSVANKEGIVELAQMLEQHGTEIIATGGTASLLKQYHLSYTEVSEYTDFPEILQGRVKTLHPKVFGGILARGKQDTEELIAKDISPIDLVVVNLYPFQKAIQKPDHSLADAIEQIDIGGVSLIRAAAKNFQHVTSLVDPKDYGIFCELLRQQHKIDDNQRLPFAQKAFQYIAWYDEVIANYFRGLTAEKSQTFPDRINLSLEKRSDLRYGENPHQHAALYQAMSDKEKQTNTLATAKLIQGKPLSYNNLIDADTALECVLNFTNQPACVIVKHANPCGVAIGENLLSAYQHAYRTDPTSAFGGIIAFNQELDAKTANAIISKQFLEVLIAPAITTEAIAILAAKPALRVLATGQIEAIKPRWDLHSISGGILIQDHDRGITEGQLQFVTSRKPTPRELQDLLFAWHVVRFVKSNAIVYAHNQATIAIGGGQTSRIFSVKSAILRAQEEGLDLTGSVMASDAFFPFRDSIDTATIHGITAIIQPGGSVRDEEVIVAADQADIAMIFTGERHFRH